jgi:hypothetical protein
MDNQAEKKYKTRKCVREAVSRYQKKLKESDNFNDVLEARRAYNKEYYQKLKEDRAKLKELLSKMPIENQ